MKKRTVNKLIVVIAVVLLVLVIHFLLIKPIWFWDLDRVELHTYDHQRGGRVTLTDFESWLAVTLYNASIFAGEVDAEPCCDEYRLVVYFEDGSRSSISEGVRSKMIVRPPNGSFYVECGILIKYIESLAIKYDLPLGEDFKR